MSPKPGYKPPAYKSTWSPTHQIGNKTSPRLNPLQDVTEHAKRQLKKKEK